MSRVLLAFVREAQIDVSVLTHREAKARRLRSLGRITQTGAPGSHSKDVRAYLKQLAGSTWPLINWLTHTSSAVRHDAELIVSATNHLIGSFAAALIRRESRVARSLPQMLVLPGRELVRTRA